MARMFVMVLAACVCAAMVAAAPVPAKEAGKTGSIKDVKHIVIFMQENRSFFQYYDSLRGVRGFNDRAAPPLPNGRPVWYQPAGPPANFSKLCGCDTCDIKWTPAGNAFKALLLGMRCRELAGDLMGAIPPIKVTQGMKCQDLLNQMYGSSYDHLPFKDFIYPGSTCPADAKVTGLPSTVKGLTGKPEPAPPVVPTEPAMKRAARGEPTSATEHYILPFNLQFDRTATQCMPAPEMDYFGDIGIVDNGLMDAWNTARAPGFGMAYFNRTDLPYYYALADAFTVGDAYFQSTFTATNPNRLHLFSGSNGLSVDSGYNQLDDSEPKPGFPWPTMAETLMDAGISWKVLQQHDNFDDNAFAWFEAFNKSRPGEPLWDNGMARVDDIVESFGKLVANDSLPQVMWIVGPTALSEHATNHPGDGEDLSHRLLEVLSDPANAEVYGKTVFILNYDEGGQFFDHMWPPMPPKDASDGASTVDVTGELTKTERFGIPAGHPIGLGFRVPLFLISPWSRGDYTFSQVSDHTSVVKFIEQRFGIHCPNISPWRRAVTSDLTAGFDFTTFDASWPSSFPSTAANVNRSKWECDHLPPPTLPAVQSLPVQEPGVRKARALPYAFDITDSVDSTTGALTIHMNVTGSATGAFQVYDMLATLAPPRKFTIEGGKALSTTYLAHSGKYNVSLHGPNGFVRKFTGSSSTAALSAVVGFDRPANTVSVAAASAAHSCSFRVVDNAYGEHGLTFTAVPADDHVSDFQPQYSADMSAHGNWYDFTVEVLPAPGCSAGFSRRFQGHMENGQHTITDPAMGQLAPWASIPAEKQGHPAIEEPYRTIQPWSVSRNCATARSRQKDACWGHGSERAMEEQLAAAAAAHGGEL